MARQNRSTTQKEVRSYRHDKIRKNIPPARIAAQGTLPARKKMEYNYNPHLTPVLRYDDSEKIDELLEKARRGPLSDEDLKTLSDALKHHAPWLEWAGKKEAGDTFTVDPVALHIHEHVSAEAIVKVAARENVQRELFADPQQEYHKALEFYQHDVEWANRLILGDSLTVMNSLAHREALAGEVQMIYIDPPYGIKFASNFQPTVFQRDVKDTDKDLTRQLEQIKAYRDTWTLGIHSYLAYLRDRLLVAKELLTDSGSIFLQINDENVHRVRCIMDEVFGSENFVSLITYRTASGQPSNRLQRLFDYIIWYAKDKSYAKYKPLFRERIFEEKVSTFNFIEETNNLSRSIIAAEKRGEKALPEGKLFKDADISRFNASEVKLLRGANRVFEIRNGQIVGKRYESDNPYVKFHSVWMDTIQGTFELTQDPKKYVVQTNPKVIQRCLLMTTEPGDLVLDPTCGSGTTAYAAERWGRRWITIDTSRVSIALTRQRLLTSSFDYYKLKDESKGVEGGFINKTVSHITLRNIVQNAALAPILEKHEPILTEKLDMVNSALAKVTSEIRTKLLTKLTGKEVREGRRSITDADRRRWQLPDTAWKESEVPFDTDPDWPPSLQAALTDYREAWLEKMDEVNACIDASCEGEELVDKLDVDEKKIRVSGPFTVEAVHPPEESLNDDSPIGGEPEEALDTFESEDPDHGSTNAEAYLDKMIGLLRNDSVRFPDDQVVKFATLDQLEGEILHAEGNWEGGDDAPRRVAVVFGPQYGPVSAKQVEECLPIASQRGYKELVLAGFSFDAVAQDVIDADPHPRVHTHMAYINPDVEMDDLLEQTSTSQLFTVFGRPRTDIDKTENGEYIVKMEGVDIYNPVDNTVSAAGADKVAGWFVDTDYDGRTFCITQAFFPNPKAWNKIARDLRSVVDAERFEQFSGTESLPFPVGEHARVAVKVIDPCGNEVMRVHALQ